MKTIIITSVVSIAIIIIGCNDNSVVPLPVNNLSITLRGSVILKNQSEYSNALVYLDSLNRGVSTDSSGDYTFIFEKKDSVNSGEFIIRYFLIDYEKDSAMIFLNKGKVKLDTLDVDGEGKIKTKVLNQKYSVYGKSDKYEYRIGDTIKYKARYTNLSNRTIHFFSGGDTGPLGWVFLYNENYPGIFLFYHDPFGADFSMYLTENKYYEDSVRYRIPSTINDLGIPVMPNLYLVVPGIGDYNKYSSIPSAMKKYVINDWSKICKGKSPRFDLYPNKYKLPTIKIIE